MEITEELRREQTLQWLMGRPIQHLLPEQRRYLQLYRQEYHAVGAATGPLDTAAAIEAISALYRLVHGRVPDQIIWKDSPRQGTLSELSIGGASLSSAMKDRLGRALQPLSDGVSSDVWREVERELSDPLRDAVDAFTTHIWAQLADLRNQRSRMPMYGSIRVETLARARYHLDILNTPLDAKLVEEFRLHDLISRLVGWWWPHREICICTARPELIEWTEDEPPRIRRVRYRDGWVVSDGPRVGRVPPI